MSKEYCLHALKQCWVWLATFADEAKDWKEPVSLHCNVKIHKLLDRVGSAANQWSETVKAEIEKMGGTVP